MHQSLARQTAALLLASFLPMFCGCGDADPPPARFGDLGDTTRPLPPSVPAWHDARVKGGNAEWKQFQPPAEKKNAAEAGAAGEAKLSPEEIADEIRALVKDHNDLIAEGKHAEVIDYYIPAQRDAAREFWAFGAAMDAKLKQLQGLLIEKKPDAKDQTTKTISLLLGPPGIDVKNLKVVSDTEAAGEMGAAAGVTVAVSFRLIEDKETKESDWYIDLSSLNDYAKHKPASEQIAAAFDGLIAGIKSGAIQPDVALTQLEQLAKMVGDQPAPTKGTSNP